MYKCILSLNINKKIEELKINYYNSKLCIMGIERWMNTFIGEMLVLSLHCSIVCCGFRCRCIEQLFTFIWLCYKSSKIVSNNEKAKTAAVSTWVVLAQKRVVEHGMCCSSFLLNTWHWLKNWVCNLKHTLGYACKLTRETLLLCEAVELIFKKLELSLHSWLNYHFRCK